MSIIVNCAADRVEVKIINGSDWTVDLERVKSIRGRWFESETKLWIVPSNQLSDIVETWPTEEIIFSGLESQLKVERLKNKEGPVELTSRAPITQILEHFIPLKWYQERFVRLNPSSIRVLLSLVMGAGKTISALERIKALATVGKVPWNRVLVVCPKRVRRNWATNIRNVLGVESVIYWGETKKKRAKLVDSAGTARAVICTYETVKELHDYIPVIYDHLIIDEAHLLSGHETKRSVSFQSVNARYGTEKPIMLLTGTPIQHKPKDLWNLVNIIDPDLAGNYWAWNERYTRVLRSIRKPIPVKRNGVVQRNPNGSIIYRMTDIPIKTTTQNLPDLVSKLSSIMYRVAPEDVFDFDPITETIMVEMEPAQRRIYEQLRDELIVEIEDRTITVGQIPTRMLRLLQACEGMFNFTRENKTSCKLDYLKDLIEDMDENEQVVHWARFQPITFEVQELFPDKAVIYNGAMSDDMNQLAVWAFNGVKDRTELEEFKTMAKKCDFKFGPGEAKVLSGVIDLRSALGVDLHEQGCAHNFYTSMSLMGAANDQAGARIIRQGQRKAIVLSQYLLCENTIEPSVFRMVLENWKTTLQILDGKESLGYQQSQELQNILLRH